MAFHSVGILPTDIKELNIRESGKDRAALVFLSNVDGIPAMPPEVLFFSFLMTLLMFSTVKRALSRKTPGGTRSGRGGITLLSVVHTDPK